MKELEKEFRQNFSKLLSFYKEKEPLTIITAFSGGVDSRVLLELVSRYDHFSKENRELAPIRQVACHVDHSLREASEKDAFYVQRICHQLNVPLFSSKLSEKPDNENLEAWAREERYKFFKNIAEYFKASALLTAHHLDDQAETVLFRLATGRLLTSKNSIVEKESFFKTDAPLAGSCTMLRPLLPFSSLQIIEWAKEENLLWVEDETNADTKRARNKIRHEVIPYLEENLSKTFSKQAAAFAAQASLDEKYLEKQADDMLPENLSKSFLRELDIAISWRVLRAYAAKQAGDNAYKVGYDKWQKLCDKLSSGEDISELEMGFGVCLKKPKPNDGSISFYSTI